MVAQSKKERVKIRPCSEYLNGNVDVKILTAIRRCRRLLLPPTDEKLHCSPKFQQATRRLDAWRDRQQAFCVVCLLMGRIAKPLKRSPRARTPKTPGSAARRDHLRSASRRWRDR